MTRDLSGAQTSADDPHRLLAASEARFRNIIEKNADGVIVIWPDGAIAFVNPAAEALLNHAACDMLGSAFGIPLVPGETTELDIPGREAGAPSLVVEMRVVETEWDGKAAYLATLRDVTERKRAEEALRAAEERFRRISEATSDFSYSLRLQPDGSAHFEWLTEAFTRLTGYTLGELRHRDWRGLVHAEDLPAVEAHLARLAAGEADVCERRILSRDGQVRWLRHSARPVRDGRDGRIVRVFGAGQDVTERRRLEQELRRRVDELAEADRRKDQFLAMLAHELRNPLAPIRNAVHVIRLTEDRNTRDQMRAIIEQQIDHLARLLDDLLDVSRITRGKINLRTEPTALVDVALRAIEPMRGLLEENGIRLQIHTPDDPLETIADPVRLQQVISNLMNNAAKFTNPNGLIRVTMDRRDHHVRIRIQDTGIGIATEMIDRIFDLFTQADHSLDRNRGGLGIGLTLARDLVQMHGGRIEAHSEGLGRGSAFTVLLPASPVEPADEPAPDASADPAESAQPAATPGCRVLIVDDNVDSSRSLAMLLGIWGHAASVVHDGPEALEHCHREHPDVVLLDIGLPRMDGYEVASRLLADPRTRDIALIAMSGYGQEDDRRRAREIGFLHHLVKPVDLHDLEAILAGIASRHAG